VLYLYKEEIISVLLSIGLLYLGCFLLSFGADAYLEWYSVPNFLIGFGAFIFSCLYIICWGFDKKERS